MSTLDHADDRRTTADLTPARAAGSHADPPGTYLTDEVFLYRVAGFVATDATEMLKLEDCYWLDVVEVPVADVRARALRLVTPAPA